MIKGIEAIGVFLLVIAGLGIGSGYAKPIVTEELKAKGLIGYWPFNEVEEQKVLDQSGNEFHGFVQGASTKEGRFGKGLDFGTGFQNRHVEIKNSKALQVSNNFTVATWIYRNALNASGESYLIKGRNFYFWSFMDELRLNLSSGKPGKGGTCYVQGEKKLGVGWQHIAATRKGDRICLYLNGEKITERRWGGKLPKTKDPLMIGSDLRIYHHSGLMDEVYLFKKALTSEEILYVMQNQVKNHIPIAQDLELSVAINQKITLPLQGEDKDNEELSYKIVSEPQFGKLERINEKYVYQPNTGFEGVDHIQYQAQDKVMPSLVATVQLTVGRGNLVDLKKGLVGAWLFNEGKGDVAHDSSPHQKNGVIKGASWTKGKIGKALDFGNGKKSASVAIPFYEALNSENGQVSVSFWIDRPRLNRGNEWYIGKSPEVGTWEWGVYGFQNKLTTGMVLAQDDLKTGWQHIVVTVDGPVTQFFINGKDSGRSRHKAISFDQAGIRIGRQEWKKKGNSAVRQMVGKIDEVYLFDRILNSAEINTLAQINNKPVAVSMEVKGKKEKPMEIKLVGVDAEKAQLTYQILEKPKHGKLVGKAPLVTYRPNAGFTGKDQFSFSVEDGELKSNTALVSLVIEE